MYIESSQNARFKAWKKLLSKKGRTQQQKFIVEGHHLVEEAISSEWSIDALIIAEGTEYPLPLEHYMSANKNLIYTLSAKLFSELSETESPQGILAVLHKQNLEAASSEDIFKKGHLLLLIDQVQDPGNLGTIIRTADAVGVDAMVLGLGTTDVYSGKTIRSTQGSIFHLPIIEQSIEDILPVLKRNGWLILGSALTNSIDYREIKVKQGQKVALIVGNEGQGIAASILNETDQNVKIPIWGKAESLNVGVAAGILLYHIKREDSFL